MGRTPLFVAALLLAIVAGGIVDLVLDRPRGLTLHVVFEATLVLLSLGTAIYLWRGWSRTRRSLREARARLRARRAERDEPFVLPRGSLCPPTYYSRITVVMKV